MREIDREKSLVPPKPSSDEQQIKTVACPRNHRQPTPRDRKIRGVFVFRARARAGRENRREIAGKNGLETLAFRARAKLDPIDHRADEVHGLRPVPQE